MKYDEVEEVLEAGGYLRWVPGTAQYDVLNAEGERVGAAVSTTKRNLNKRYGLTKVTRPFTDRPGYYPTESEIAQAYLKDRAEREEERQAAEREAEEAEKKAQAEYEGTLDLHLARCVEEASWEMFNSGKTVKLSEIAAKIREWRMEFENQQANQNQTVKA